MELRDYVRVLRRGWLLVVIFAAVGAGAATAQTTRQTRMYAASVTMIISSPDSDSSASAAYQANLLSQQRVKSYADLVASDRIAQSVITQLKLKESATRLRGQITAQAVPDTVLLRATVTDPAPARAQLLANTVGAVFSTAIARIDMPGGRRSTPSVRVTVWEEAKRPVSPVSPKPVRAITLGLLAGLVLGVGAAVLRGRLDTSITTEDQIREVTGLPTLGEVAGDAGGARHPLFLHGEERSRRVEEFRQLRTNLRFADVDARATSILVTSPLPGDGKTTTSCNLAITSAQTGARVILVEADLRRPSFGPYLGLEPTAGLTSVLIGAASLDDVVQPWGGSGLDVLCSGPVPPNPTELLGSRGMSTLLAELTDRYDLVILDAPPLLPVADASVLATEVAGVLVVARAGRTRRDQMARAVERLTTVDARILGVLLNMVPVRRVGHYGYARSYSQYSQVDERR
ncbi:MAG: polysaccharide biosynthesis tyrosine autokinase, partial [Frankia sp.]